jgi:hypothetical protein
MVLPRPEKLTVMLGLPSVSWPTLRRRIFWQVSSVDLVDDAERIPRAVEPYAHRVHAGTPAHTHRSSAPRDWLRSRLTRLRISTHASHTAPDSWRSPWRELLRDAVMTYNPTHPRDD